MPEKAIIGLEADGWTVVIGNGKTYRWNHNDEDLGTAALSVLLSDLGFDVKLEDWY